MCSSHAWGSGSCPFDPEPGRSRPPQGGRRAPRPWSLAALRAEMRLGPTRRPALDVGGNAVPRFLARRRHVVGTVAVLALFVSALAGLAL